LRAFQRFLEERKKGERAKLDEEEETKGISFFFFSKRKERAEKKYLTFKHS